MLKNFSFFAKAGFQPGGYHRGQNTDIRKKPKGGFPMKHTWMKKGTAVLLSLTLLCTTGAAVFAAQDDTAAPWRQPVR